MARHRSSPRSRRTYRACCVRKSRAPKRSYAKRRSYRRKRTGGMSKKRILNASSTKKRNTMLSVSNTTTTGTTQPLSSGPAFVTAATSGRFLFCPTALDLDNNAGAPNLRINVAQRTATTCYMRGFAEHLRIQTTSGLPWFHRRICFTTKTDQLVTSTADTPVQANPYYVETSSGYQRAMLNLNINAQPNTINNIEGVIFRGANGLDWTDNLIAPVDTTRISVKFDKTWTIRSGNANGTVIERKLWHPMNKNLVYDDDESGNSMVTARFSVDSKLGMGDYYVYDIFSPGEGGSATDRIVIVPNSTLYWHEK